jgi:fructokinase
VDGVAQVSCGFCAQAFSVDGKANDKKNPMTKPAVMIGVGEVLWDLLPSGRVLGGAPANFAYMTNVLGDQGIVASRVGRDELGREASKVMQQLGLTVNYLQQDSEHETGAAVVTIGSDGQPTFLIKEPAAWDFLEWSPDLEELSARADVICFGSLAQRSTESASTIERFLKNAPKTCLRICDVNLRQSFYSKAVLHRSSQHSDIVKLNGEELVRVASLLGLGNGGERAIATRLLDEFDLRLVCITRGDRGSVLISPREIVEHKGFRVKVEDAVGAGDAFTACLAHHYWRGCSLEETSEAANRFASWVATQRGATPPISSMQLQNILTGAALR